MRTRRLAATALVSLVCLLGAACGGSDDGAAPATTGGASDAGQATTASSRESREVAFPVTIEHVFGSTTIEETPERVVTLGYGEGDIVAALGIVPVAINAYGTRGGQPSPWFAEAVDGAEVRLLDMTTGVPYEEIASLRPDVILGLTSDIDEAAYDLLAAIAPTVAYQTGPFQDSWEDASTTAGEALGLRSEAEALIDEVDASTTAAAEASPELAGRTASVVLAISPGQVGVLNSTEENTVRLLGRLGVDVPPAVAALGVGPTGYSAVVGLEQVGVLDADVLLLHAITDEGRQALLSSPVFGGLGVVQRGDVLPLEPAVWSALRTPSVLAIPYALDQLLEPLRDAVAA